MSSTLAHGAGNRSLGEPIPLGALAASPALVILLLAGLGLRLTIAYVLFPASGFATDLSSYASWALTLGAHGPAGFYANAGFSDYPPGYLYLLWPIGALAHASLDPTGVASGLVKLPPMLIDVAVAYVLYRLVRGWAWPGRAAEGLALAAAALYLFNPVSFYDSALWGQTDAAGALLVLLGVAALIRGNSEGATALATMAALIKPQFGVVLIPLVGFVLLKRHLLRAGSGPRHRPWGPPALARWLEAHGGPVRLLTSLAVGLLVFHVVALPFGLDIPGYIRLMAETAGGYEFLTVNAFNPWALVGSDGGPSFAAAQTWASDTVPWLGPVPAVAVGATLLVGGFLWALARAAVRDDRWTIIVAALVLAIGFFVLPTRVHERYVFPAVALLPLLAVVSRRWLVALVLLSVGAIINMHAILTWPLYATENVADLPLGPMFRTMPFIVASALLQAGVLLFAAWELRPSLETSPDGFDRISDAPGRASVALPPSDPLLGPVAGRMPPTPATTRVDAWARAAASPVGSRTTAEWVRGPGVLDQLTRRFTRPPLRRPIDASERRERTGRLDRLDVLVLVLLVVSAATIRGFRSDEPYGMYFDEVYHARTATEFLQHWEYGEPHAIYEYTHPHLAKYAMAAGIALLGGHQVSGLGDIGAPVVGAAIESSWAPPSSVGDRNGDRLYVATGSELRIHDLGTRAAIGSLAIPATALAVDPGRHRLFIAEDGGAIRTIDTTVLDLPIIESILGPGLLDPFSDGDGTRIERLIVTDGSVVALDAEGGLDAYDIETGVLLGSGAVAGAGDLVEIPWTDRVIVDRASIADVDDVADRLAGLLGADSAELASRLSSGTGAVVVAAYLDEPARTEVADAIEAGTLEGVRLEGAPMLAIAGETGVSIADATTLDVVEELFTVDPVAGLTLVERGLDEPTVYAASGDTLQVIPFGDDGPAIGTSIPMPGDVRTPVWNEPANLVHVAGDSPSGGSTVYVVELHGGAVFGDAALPFEPNLLLVDVQPERPSLDRGQALAFGPDGRVASIDVLRDAAAWRMPGILMGALAAGLIYLLARLLFARRSVGLMAGGLVLVEGMLFANARIAMNDVYVTTFILLAAVLFVPVYTGIVRRHWKAAGLIVAVGLALGLALASKWVALYAIGALVLLVLLRSGLGRLIALAGFIAATAVLGALAIRPSEVPDPSRNWTFLAIMVLLTMLLAAGIVRRPLPLSRPEALIGGALPIVAGVGLMAGSFVSDALLLDGLVTRPRLLLAGGAAIVGGAGVLALAWWSRRRATPTMLPRGRRRPSVWLTPARALGLGWLFTLTALAALPVAIYVLSYAPWVELGNQWFEGFPAEHTGQTLAELTGSMYEYHDDLRAEHAASSPWWAWPLDLKPVWFYQDGFAGPTTGLIHDTGNLVVFWLGIPAIAFASWAAWRRRSISLGVVVVLWLALWLPWARIDRATFQYHVYASLPFLVISLAYLLAELWRGPGLRTWFVVRVATALAVLGVPLLWLAREPLCRLAGTSTANPDGVACGSIERVAQVSPAAMGALLVLALGATVIAWLTWRGSGSSRRSYPASGTSRARRVSVSFAVVAVALATLGGVVAATLVLDRQASTTFTVSPELLALLGLVVLSPVAWIVLRARDSRRFVLGVLAAAAVWFVVWYPNIAGLPLPADIAHVYQGVLPTWNWAFQFTVNLDPPATGPLADSTTFVLAIVAAACAAGAAVAARSWGRRPRTLRSADPADPRRTTAAGPADPRVSSPGGSAD